MSIFGFNVKNEKKFVNITCNIILSITIVCVLALSIFSPTTTSAFVSVSTPIYNGNKSSNNVSLMINVYWGSEYIDEMLDILEENDVKTTFFVGGYWVAKNNELLKKIVLKGHEVGNHGYHHKDHSKLTKQQNIDEIYITGELVKSVANIDMNLFAPPSGSYNDKVLSVAENLGYKTIMWSRDTIDWRDKDSDLIFSRATSKTVGGDLILMHPTEKTVNALDNIIKNLKAKGLNPTTVSNTIN